MKKNFLLLLITALIFGISTGIYEYVVPLYLNAIGISFKSIGEIFAIAGVIIIIARIYIGNVSDRLGRKGLYTAAFVICSLSTIGIPFFFSIISQTVLKTIRDFGALTRETLFPVILYEEADEGFLGRIGKMRGYEFLMQAVGTVIVVLVIGNSANAGNTSNMEAFKTSLIIAGALLLIGSLLWTTLFKEQKLRQAEKKEQPSLVEIFSFKGMHRNLVLLAVASMIITCGVMFSHGFYLPFFFRDHFGLEAGQIGTWLIIHRITIGLPLLFAIFLPYKNFKMWFVGGIIFEGLSLIFGSISTNLWVSMPIWMMHDLIGGGIWVPIQATLIQRYSNPNRRGLEVSKVLAFSSIGGIIGPLLCGKIAGHTAANMPLIISGIIVGLAAIPLMMLKNDEKMKAAYVDEEETTTINFSEEKEEQYA